MKQIHVDYNNGATVYLPGGEYHVIIKDRNSNRIIFDDDTRAAEISSYEKYYVNFRVEVYKDGELVFSDNMDLKNKNVLITFPPDTLGDAIAWIASAAEFKKRHRCKVYCSMSESVAELLKNSYQGINFISPKDKLPGIYATYHLGFWRPPTPNSYQPADWRTVGLQEFANRILGLPDDEIRAKIKTSKKRTIKEQYVCIATQSTAQCKYWNNKTGWAELVEYLKQQGYRVLCIDKNKRFGSGTRWNNMPDNAEDFTGEQTLQERADLIAHAEFFIGLGSGLSWLAWAVGVPVVLISGFSEPFAEFETPYRVINRKVCHGCWNDTDFIFEAKRWDWCPKYKGFECTKEITGQDVISVVKCLIENAKK